MNAGTGRVVLLVMGLVGWVLACVFGVLACMLVADARGHDVPWQILGAIVLGPMLASVPIGITLFAAYRAFSGQLPSKSAFPAKLIEQERLNDVISWQWIVLAVLCGVEILVLPLTLVAARAEDDSLLLSIPLNLALAAAILFVACFPYRKHASIAVCAIHLIGIAIATIAAAIEIESVIVTGLVLLVTGIAVASVGTRPHVARVFFGLSTVGFIVTSFLIIAIGGVGQRAAEAPLFAAIVAYQILFVPLGLLVLYCTLTDRQLQLRPQLGLKQLVSVVAMAGVAMLFAWLASSVDEGPRVAIAVCLAILILGGLTAVIGTTGWAKWSGKMVGLQETKFA